MRHTKRILAARRHPEPKPDFRSEYQRDRDRIIHSNAFRRLVYKTQVFVTMRAIYTVPALRIRSKLRRLRARGCGAAPERDTDRGREPGPRPGPYAFWARWPEMPSMPACVAMAALSTICSRCVWSTSSRNAMQNSAASNLTFECREEAS